MRRRRKIQWSLGSLATLRFRPIYHGFRSEAPAFLFLCLYVLMEYLRPQNSYPILDVGPLGLIALGLCVGGVIISGARPLRFGPIDFLFLVFSFLLVLSIVNAYFPTYSLRFRNTYISWFLLYFSVTSLLTTPRRAFLFWLFFFLINFKMSQHGTRTFAMRGFTFTHWGVAGAGLLKNSGEMALEMTVFFSLSWGLLSSMRATVTKKRWLTWVGLLPGTALITVVASSSRGGQLALAIVGVVILLTSGLQFRKLVFVFFAFSLGFFLLPQEQRERFTTMGEDETSTKRLVNWAYARQIIREHPYTGIGYKNWLPYFNAHFEEEGATEEIHNTVLEAFVDMGFPGGLVFLSLFATALVTNVRSQRRFKRLGPDGKPLAGMALGLNLGLIGTFVSAYFMSVLYYPMFWLAFAQTSALRNLSLEVPRPRPLAPQPVQRPQAMQPALHGFE